MELDSTRDGTCDAVLDMHWRGPSRTMYQVPRQVMSERISASVHDGGSEGISEAVRFHACERMSEPGYGGMCCKLGTCTRTGTIVPVLVL